jgi:hypothetical protein
MIWRIAVLVGWIGALAGLVSLSDGEGTLYATGGVPLTVAVGALIDRWWVGVAPLVVTVVLVGGIFALIGGCDGDCGGDDGFGAIVRWFVLLFTAPATVALLLGVGARRALRRSRPPAPHA